MSTFHKFDVRPTEVAGQFYPAEPTELRALITALLASAGSGEGPVPKAVIAPHAGNLYSGPIAASSYGRLLPARSLIKKVVLLGPTHRVAFQGLATSSFAAYATPLGPVRCDLETSHRLESFSQVSRLDEAHFGEHSLEVHLPFLQVALEEFSIVPLVVGETNMEDISEVLEAVWGGPETRFVISSDLSHYHDVRTARQIDARTARSIELLRAEEIDATQACGRLAIQGLIHAARHRGLEAHTLDLRNSGDTGGPSGRVVGYGAFEFAEPRPVTPVSD